MSTAKRGRWMGLVGALVLVLGAGLTWTVASKPQVDTEPPVAAVQSQRAPPVWAAPAPTGDARITGTVLEDKSPVPGTRVFASRRISERVLAEVLPCIERESTAPGQSVASQGEPPCWALDPEELREQVEVYARAARPLAEAITGKDGVFTLEGLAEGQVMLWALGDTGAAVLPEVKTGAPDVSLPLEAGSTFRGQVVSLTDEQPIANARVFLLGHSRLLFFETTTDAEGRYSFGPLPEVDYAAVVMAEGWGSQFFWHGGLLRERVRLGNPTRFAGRVVSPRGTPVAGIQVELERDNADTRAATLTDSQGRFTFTVPKAESGWLFAENPSRGDFGRIHTPPGDDLVLELKPGIHLEGTVRDEEGRSIAGAQVKALRLGAAVSPQLSTVTDSAGRYRLGPLEPMAFVDLEAFHKAHPMAHGTPLRREVSVEAAHYLDDSRIHEGGENTSPMDFTLKRAATVDGIVVDPEGNPLRDVSVLLAVDKGDAENPSYLHGEATLTDESGRFSVDIDREGEGWIDAESADFTMDSIDVKIPTQGLRLVLDRRPTLPGMVVDAAGNPLPNVFVYLHVAGDESIRGMETSDEEGRFVFKDLLPGRYTLTASLWTGGNATQRELTQSVEVREGEASETVVLRLEAGRSLHGLVVDTEGRPLSDVRVLAKAIIEGSPDGESFDATYSPQGVPSNAEGRFVLRDLSEPRYGLAVASERYRLDPARSRGGTLVGKSYRVARDAPELRLVMTREPRVRGRLVQEDGAPLPQAQVGRRGATAKDGSFDVARDEFDHERLVIEHQEFVPLVRELAPRGEGDQDFGTLTMLAGRTVRGVLRDPVTGKPYMGRVQGPAGEEIGTIPILVMIEPEDGRGAGTRMGHLPMEPEEDGTLVLKHLPSVPLVMEVIARPYHLPLRLRLGPNQTSFDVSLVRGPSVEVVVRDLAGKLLNAEVTLSPKEVEGDASEVRYPTYTGKFTTNMLMPGLYIAKARALDDDKQGLVFSPMPLRIPASGTVSFTLTPTRP
ncbi:carboxypeptidase regulatory-like domain-containing protein [Myxococcus landrumensis]|uniref:Carboxypeptidase regulatory-like domain-containing protein n=1 Tax=Myxococcus landrumensis TaxID=2813577 RepID=A0ABX7N6S5_9BACT|nr:carboxypeptidase regulatory-like domain-containing protein [Myxococcus landrumus]QSQ14158.1 carboxypeptidase regulatory-like domain-containing protein [Myxococcus landrumus]